MSDLTCYTCGAAIVKKPRVCRECRRVYDAAWRKRRLAAGLPAYGSKTWAPEKRAAWEAKRRGSEHDRALRRTRNAAYRVRPEHHNKILAREAVRRALNNGRLVRRPCEVCGTEKAQAHHDDYSQQLAVRWLCPKHHAEADQSAHAEMVAREVQDEKTA